MYHESQMRRALSIFLTLFFSLGPLAVTLWAGDDARLPACCRRAGAHHCAMSMETAASLAAAASGKSIFAPPSTCPQFPASSAANTTPIHALAPATASLPNLIRQPNVLARASADARCTPIRIRSTRAPPVTNPA